MIFLCGGSCLVSFFYPLRNHTIIHFGANYRYSSNNKTQTLYHTDCYLFSQELNFVNTGTGLYRGILNFAICPLVSCFFGQFLDFAIL